MIERLPRVVEIAAAAWQRPTYLLQPIALGDRRGLYARDLLNRSPFRRRLQRLGAEFTDDPFVTFTESNRFHCKDWGEFEPSFVVTRGWDEDPDKVMESTDALLAFRLATFRMGGIGASELARLVQVSSRLESAAAKNAEAVFARLAN